MRQSQPTILISGLTAAGKTTHARLLATHWGCEYLGASQLRRVLLRTSSDDLGHEWDPAIDLRRRDSPVYDRVLDEIISRQVQASVRPLIVDAWLQPWLCADDSAIRVWIESSLEARVRKATVTCLRNETALPFDLESQIAAKDDFSHSMFTRLYGIDFGPDPEIFDLIVDNSQFIAHPTVEASDFGISQFEPLLEQAIEEECTRRLASSPIASCVRPKWELPISAGMTDRSG